MSTNYKALYSLLDKMLDGGLPVIAAYLENMIGHPIIITDAVGRIYYPDMAGIANKADNMYIDLMDEFKENVYYNSATHCLYYNIYHKSSIAYVIVENLPADLIKKSATFIEECTLAIKYYFSLHNKQKEDFGEALWDNLFNSTGANITDKLKLYEQNMDFNNYYFVSILDVEDGASNLDWNLLRSCIYETLHRNRTEYVTSIIAPSRLVTILKGNPRGGPMDIDPDWPARELADTNKEMIEKKFHIKISRGLGKSCRPSNLLKSYQQACIALALPRQMGKKQFIQYFSKLGVFSIIFSHDPEIVKDYCLQVLGKVIEHDEKSGTDFLGTLRILLDNSCSWTTAANQLYVHVNTVYYRMVKVEQLLDVDFSEFETRLHLFTAIRAWDTLQICELLD